MASLVFQSREVQVTRWSFPKLMTGPVNKLLSLQPTSGYAACLAMEQHLPIRLLWTSPNVQQAFGDKLVDSILEKNPDAVIYGQCS